MSKFVNYRIKSLEKKILSAKCQSLARHSDHPRDLECVICLEIPPLDSRNSIHIYSCCQHHLLCGNCLKLLDTCPICRQSFKLSNPQRNFLAERLVLQYFDEKAQNTHAEGTEEFEGLKLQYT